MKFDGKFEELQLILDKTGLEWSDEGNKKIGRRGKAILNYWETTGTLNFQGPEHFASELKSHVRFFLEQNEPEQTVVDTNQTELF